MLEVNNHLRRLYNQIEPEKDERKTVKKPNTKNSTCTLLVCKRQNKVELYFDDPHQQGPERLTEEKLTLMSIHSYQVRRKASCIQEKKRVKV